MENNILEHGVFYTVVNGICDDSGILEIDDDKIVEGLVKAGVIRQLKLSYVWEGYYFIKRNAG